MDPLEPAFWQPFFSPFSNLIRIRKAFIFNKNERNKQKVYNKVSGRVREGFIVQISASDVGERPRKGEGLLKGEGCVKGEEQLKYLPLASFF